MVTGIEAAGLALGLFPVVLEGLKLYITSADTVREMKRHKRTLNQFQRDISMEKCKFEITWNTLVGRAGLDLGTLGEQPWEPHVEAALISSLPAAAAGSFADGCQDLNTILEELAQRFVKYEKDKAGYLKMLRVLLDFPQEYRERQILRIHRLNFNLDKVVAGSPPVIKAPGVSKRADITPNKTVMGHYHRVRMHAIMVYTVLNEKLRAPTCLCNAPHSANLRLEMRFAGETSNQHCEEHCEDDASADGPLNPRFNLAYALNMHLGNASKVSGLREFEIQHLEEIIETPAIFRNGFRKKRSRDPSPNRSLMPYSNKRPRSPAPNPATSKQVVMVDISCDRLKVPQIEETAAITDRIIKCLCSTIQGAVAGHTRNVGVLVSNDNKRHRVRIPRKDHNRAVRTMSIGDLLATQTREPSTKERLKLGVKLASSIMQLHKTQWLNERWSKHDIIFYVEEVHTRPGSRSILENPRVHRVFTSVDAPGPLGAQGPVECRLVRCNQTLFSLGIILIELWYWKSIELLYEPETPRTQSEVYINTLRLVDELYDDAGEVYGDVVRRCIAGLDHKETQLEREDYKKQVYVDIVWPLQQHLEAFACKSLSKIFAEGG